MSTESVVVKFVLQKLVQWFKWDIMAFNGHNEEGN
jgi:hypothetical protein